MLYRILHSVNEYFALTVFWLYVAAFAVTFPFVFVFPPMPLVMIFLAVACLGFVVILAKILRSSESLVVRRMVRRGRCPNCLHTGLPANSANEPWLCDHCGAVFQVKPSVAANV